MLYLDTVLSVDMLINLQMISENFLRLKKVRLERNIKFLLFFIWFIEGAEEPQFGQFMISLSNETENSL